jgi:hypothetical protein
MDERHVTHIRKQADDDVSALGNPDEPWSPRQKQDAIDDIARGSCLYYVLVKGRRRVIGIVEGSRGTQLRTDLGPPGDDLLLQLPET